jgi:glycosyltransferase involved in cell wall biosynthesis
VSKINERVVVLSVDQWLDGLHGASILRLFKALTKLGYRVKVYVPSDKKIIMEDGFLSVMTLEVKRYVPLVTLISLYRRALKLIFEEKSSVLIFDPIFFPLFLLNRILRKSKGFMLILSRPLPQKNFLGLVRALHFWLSLMLARAFVNAFTAVTPFEAAEFARIGKIPKHKITVIPSPLGEEFQKFSFPIDENEVRLKLGWNALSGKKVLLYQGVLAEIRGVLKILELFIQSFKENDKTILLVVGDGPARDSVKNFISRNKANNIILSDPVPYSKMPEVVAACDVGLVLLPDNPWWGNQCPTKLIEFLALGKPVIASDLPGIRWIAGNSPLVFYMKKMTVSSYKEALRKLFIKKQGIIADSPRVRQEMIERFSSYSVALKLSKMISSV